MEIVKIGNQEWSTVNLNVDKFNNGDIIPEIKTVEEWRTAALNKRPAWCYYDNNPENGVKFGRLYNWYAAIDPRGISPENFRIPTNDDINQLIINLTGGVNISLLEQRTIAGRDLINLNEWEVPKLSKAKFKELKKYLDDLALKYSVGIQNSGLGFNVLPGGHRIAVGFRDFSHLTDNSFWTSSPNDYNYSEEQLKFMPTPYAYYYSFDYFGTIAQGKLDVTEGRSIRVLRNLPY
jgi:uncharacterized protein (TIGR02145 family)